MSEEKNGQEPENITPEGNEGTEGTNKKTLESLTPEELIAHIRELRSENAKARTEKNELKTAAERWAEYEESQKTELQKAQERAAKLESELSVAQRERLQNKVGKAAGVDPDLWDRIKGDSEDEMLEDAQKLAGKAPAKSVLGTTDVFAGKRGEPIGSSPADPKAIANSHLAQLIWGTGR